MIEIKDKEVEKCGWSGPLLWVSTKDGYAVHLYDATIMLNDTLVEIGSDINKQLKNQIIKSTDIDNTHFIVKFKTGDTLAINSEEHETARVFEQNGTTPHCVYENGEYCCD